MVARTINRDFINIAYVFGGCFLYMWFHTGSGFIALFSLLNVMMSFPVALVLYTYVGQIPYFSSLHLSVIIIVVGIGADDIFVFHDYWKNTFHYKALEDKPKLRLTLAFRRASKAMLVTSLTSAVAFSACTTADVMPVRAFGWFATLVVPLVFLQTIFV